MKTIVSALVGGLLVILGYQLRSDPRKGAKQQLYCADIELTQKGEGIYHAEPCMNKASVILGMKSLCDDHLDMYLSEMTGTLEE